VKIRNLLIGFGFFYAYRTGCSGQVKLSEMIEARLLTRSINGKELLVLTSMVDPMRFFGADVVEIHIHRWEIKREMKHRPQQHRLTLCSKKV
jgi:hypothetical protein